MTKKQLLQEAREIYYDWEKRKSWYSDYAGAYTTSEEDKMARILLALIFKLEK